MYNRHYFILPSRNLMHSFLHYRYWNALVWTIKSHSLLIHILLRFCFLFLWHVEMLSDVQLLILYHHCCFAVSYSQNSSWCSTVTEMLHFFHTYISLWSVHPSITWVNVDCLKPSVWFEVQLLSTSSLRSQGLTITGSIVQPSGGGYFSYIHRPHWTHNLDYYKTQ